MFDGITVRARAGKHFLVAIRPGRKTSARTQVLIVVVDYVLLQVQIQHDPKPSCLSERNIECTYQNCSFNNHQIYY
ncbi:hypothetical protein Y032_0192g1352 [Ancylostoma ceylanicum]|uniref:Uncharacterized protein n=1 Tax=Ancylostoma ceylanicum TaxID=53326 RepID=A0A016SPI5_9BILA|nr:hypothetical protein Y032_0192g1352 [Ancylostoma ceylanicum]